MAGLVLSSPVVVPDNQGFTGIYAMDQWWEPGNSDERWDLTTGGSGIALQAGVRGLTMPKFTRYTQKSAARAGSHWRGYNTDEREVFWPLAIYSEAGSQAWIEHDRRFWAGLRPDTVGLWTVTQPGGESRQLAIRFAEDTEDALDIAPELVGWQVYGLSFIAEQPYWTGEPVQATFGPDATLSTFLGSGGPPFSISPRATVASATIGNPGDVDAWPVWTLHGPLDSASVGAGGLGIDVPIALADEQWLYLDTDPAHRVLLYGEGDLDPANGEDRTDELGTASFGMVPPSGEAELLITITGTGRVDVELRPNYFRAW